MTQTARLIAYLRANPGASSLEITHALALVNVTGRVSDARAQGVAIECRKRADGRLGYYIIEGEDTVCVVCGLALKDDDAALAHLNEALSAERARPAPLSGKQESLAL